MAFVTGTLVLETKTVVSKPETIVLEAGTMVFPIKKIFSLEETTVFGIDTMVCVTNTIVAVIGTMVREEHHGIDIRDHGPGCKDYCVGCADYGVQGFIHRIFDRQHSFANPQLVVFGVPARSHHFCFGKFTVLLLYIAVEGRM